MARPEPRPEHPAAADPEFFVPPDPFRMDLPAGLRHCGWCDRAFLPRRPGQLLCCSLCQRRYAIWQRWRRGEPRPRRAVDPAEYPWVSQGGDHTW